MSIADCLTEHARSRPQHAAVIDGGRVITYAELDRCVQDAAANLNGAGISPGDVVAISLPDCAEYLITLLALARCGAIMLGIDGDLPAAEKERAAASAKAKAVIQPEGAAAIGGVQAVDAASICRPALRAFEPPSLVAEHPLMLAQSSGTTGAPKSLVWSHAQMRLQARRHQHCFGWTRQDRHLAVVSMRFFWERELCLILFCLGATTVISRADSVAALVEQVRTDEVTILALTPAHLGPLLEHASDRLPFFPSLRTLIVGSAPITNERRRLVRQRLTPNFYEQLGTNEAGLLVLGSPVDQDACPDAIGRVVHGLEARVVDAKREPLPAGQVGLVGFRGEGVPNGYIDAPEASRQSFRDGWFYPGDLAAIDAQGYFLFKGRADDAINSAGAKFYPIEVEKALMAHPAVAEAAVCGWPDPQLGEVAVAFVARSGKVSAAELVQFCKLRLAGHKIPRWIAFVAEMPKTSTGKILKRVLKENASQLLAGRGG